MTRAFVPRRKVDAFGGTPINVRLYLVRHATHADYGRRLTGRAPGVPLSAVGQVEAEALARRLAGEGLSEVQTSPRERALETAQVIGTNSGIAITVEDALDEIDFGDWTGSDFAELGGPDWEAWNARRGTARCPGGESMVEAADRIGQHMERLVQDRNGQGIALVTHADMIRGLVALTLGLSLDNLLRFEVAPASVSRIEAGPGWSRVLSLNEMTRTPA